MRLTCTALYTMAFLLAVGRLTGLLGPAAGLVVSGSDTSVAVFAEGGPIVADDPGGSAASCPDSCRCIGGCPPEAFRIDDEEPPFTGGRGSDEAGRKPCGGPIDGVIADEDSPLPDIFSSQASLRFPSLRRSDSNALTRLFTTVTRVLTSTCSTVPSESCGGIKISPTVVSGFVCVNKVGGLAREPATAFRTTWLAALVPPRSG